MHYAAFYGHADVARALILGGANVCSRGGGNSTPLHFAAWGGNIKVVRLLLDYGADVEAHDTEGNAPQVRDAVANFNFCYVIGYSYRTLLVHSRLRAWR